MSMFPENAPSAPVVFFRSYSHNNNGVRETWKEVCDRTIDGLSKIGKFTDEEAALVYQQQYNFKCLSSGRWLWVGGRLWVENPKNFPGAYNCTSLQVNSLEVFGILMDLAMMGCGTGGVLTHDCISRLPVVRNKLEVKITSEIGTRLPEQREEKTRLVLISDIAKIWVGDSREGWAEAYQAFINLAFDRDYSENQTVKVHIDLGSVRPAGEKLNGFGGVSNPIKLPELFKRCSKLLNGAIGRQLNSLECCLLIDEAAATIVAGSIRRTAGMRQFNDTDKLAETAKDNLWYQDEIDGKWRIDEKRDALRMSNHSRVFYSKPTLEECTAAVRKQYYSGEGAIQWAGEAVARGNCDILNTFELKSEFLSAYVFDKAEHWLQKRFPQMSKTEVYHRLHRYGLNPCHSGDTLVSTDRGLVAIKDLVGKHFQALVDLRSVGLAGLKLTDAIAFSTGVQSTYSILLENGLQMRCTADHQHFTDQGWVATKDLVPDIAIYIQRGEGFFGESDISVNQAQMLGWLYGDGSICQGRRGLDAMFYINQKEYPTAFPVLFEAVESLTGYQHTPSFVKGLYTFHSGSHLMHAFFDKLGVESKNCLPNSFLSQSKEVIIGFLQGLFSSDGAATVKAKQISLWNRSYELLRQIQLLLLNLGIKSSLKRKQKPGGAGIPYTLKDGTKKISQNQGTWSILIYSGDGARNFYDLIGFPLAPEKQQRLEQIVNKPQTRHYCEAVVNQRYTSKVKSVEVFGEEPVYDLHVPLTHSFIANGCITHNCGEILGADFMCDLSEVHLNNIDARSLENQVQAFKAGALSVSALLHHQFDRPLLQKSRELDPIVGVSFTGLFDFFVQGFGVDWLRWWQAGRPEFYEIMRVDPAIETICEQFNIEIDDYETLHETGWNFGMLYRDLERTFLESWREIVENTVQEYCEKHGLKCPNRCTTVQPAGCATKDALRIFDQGLLFADEHMDAAIGECDLGSENLTVRGGIPILTGIANEELDLVRITLENGRQLTMTPNHRLSINNMWVHAETMQVGQQLDVAIGEYNNAEEALLEYVEIQIGKGRPQIGCKLPSKMSVELGYFIGCLFGNGCFSEDHHRIRFSHGNKEILERISEFGVLLFGLKGVFNSDSRGGRFELTFANKQLYQWFVANNIHKSVKSNALDRIPQKLRMSSRESLLGFFAGLIDTDGCIRKEGSLSIDSASEPFLRHLQQIGEAIGLSFSFFSNTEGKNHQEVKAMFGLCLSRMKSLNTAISFINQYSIKARYRPLLPVKRVFSFNPYKIAKVETGIVDYTYDYAVEGEDDNDSWYWQGAIKSHNTKSLLTGASPGWHPPKSSLFIRRITVGKNNPIALAAIDCGYSVVPAQSDKDENGQLLDDPFDERCTEWLIEIPTQTVWAMWPGVQDIDISKFSAEAQFDFYMQVQKFYTRHNTSATIEVREHEVDGLAKRIFDAIQNDEGYVSAAILARFDEYETFPRMPFQPISRETYDRLCQEVEARRTCDDFYEAISKYTSPEEVEGPAACDSDKCLMPLSDKNS